MITKIINGILQTGHFPCAWKEAKIIPVHKKGRDHKLMSSYRPISLLPSLSKICERIIKKRFTSFLLYNNLIANDQFGFRDGHSTTDQLIRIADLITVIFNKKLHTGALLLDIEKAFDTVWIYGLIDKMIQVNFPV